VVLSCEQVMRSAQKLEGRKIVNVQIVGPSFETIDKKVELLEQFRIHKSVCLITGERVM
jgi:hypothetical protein